MKALEHLITTSTTVIVGILVFSWMLTLLYVTKSLLKVERLVISRLSDDYAEKTLLKYLNEQKSINNDNNFVPEED